MGSTTSREEGREDRARSHEQLLERLRTLDAGYRDYLRQMELKAAATAAASAGTQSAKLDKEYVFVHGGKDGSESFSAPPPDYFGQSSRDVSVTAAEDWQRKLLEDPKNRLAISAFSSNPATSILGSRAAAIADTHTFNIRIPQEGAPITNQRASGRCWLFATTNVLRIPLMKLYNLKSFELSQAYLFFWDKLEKSNFFLEQIISTADEPLDGRLVARLLSDPVGDGGQWDMALNLVEKYGLIPQTLYPDSFNAMNSSAMDQLITTKLRENAMKLRGMANASRDDSSIRAAKAAMLREIHLIITVMLGPAPPPTQKFKWEFQDADGKFHSKELSPIEFARGAGVSSVVRKCDGVNVHKLFSLVNDPRNEYETLLTVEKLGNVTGGRPVTYVNCKSSVLKAAAIAMLEKGHPVFFGCDVGKYSDSKAGIMDTALYDYELGFNVKLGMSKAQRLRTGESAMTHAMVLTGVQVEKGHSVRWRVENSWSDASGDKGYFVMTDAWFDEFTYQVVVDPAVVPENIKDVLKTEPTVLPLWDPMGALA